MPDDYHSPNHQRPPSLANSERRKPGGQRATCPAAVTTKRCPAPMPTPTAQVNSVSDAVTAQLLALNPVPDFAKGPYERRKRAKIVPSGPKPLPVTVMALPP